MAEPLNATFFAFRKREGTLLLPASLTFCALFIVLLTAFGVTNLMLSGQNPADIMRVLSSAEIDPEALQAAFTPGALIGLLLSTLVFVFLICVAAAAYEAACLRWMIRGERKGLFGFSLDADTWRVYGVYWVWLVFCIIGAILFMIFMAIVGMALGAAFGPDSPVMLVLPALFFFIPIYFGVRLAPAAATCVAERRFVFFDAWKVSSDRFWALFGAFLLLWLGYLVFSVALSGGLWVWAFGWDGVMALAAKAHDAAALQIALREKELELLAGAITAPIYWGVQIVSSVAGLLYCVALFGVNARAASAALDEGKIAQES